MTRPRGCRTVICECYTSGPWTAHNRLAYTQMIDGAQRAAVDTLGDALFTIVDGPGQAGTATSPTSSEKLARPAGLETRGADFRKNPARRIAALTDRREPILVPTSTGRLVNGQA
jgi:hypothetical protein